MNIRIDAQSIRFRITEEELNSLCEGTTLFEEICFDQGSFQFEITPKDSNVKPIYVFWRGTRMVLEIEKIALDHLYSLGRSKEGVRSSQGSIDIRLEVDVLSDKRPKISAEKNAMPEIRPLSS